MQWKAATNKRFCVCVCVCVDVRDRDVGVVVSTDDEDDGRREWTYQPQFGLGLPPPNAPSE